MAVLARTIGAVKAEDTGRDLGKTDTAHGTGKVFGEDQIFLFATISAYWALRARGVRRLERLEFTADVAFLLGKGLMTGICLFITYAIST